MSILLKYFAILPLSGVLFFVPVLSMDRTSRIDTDCNSIQFHRRTTGVIFSPYVDHRENREDYEDNYFMAYTLENIKTMLEVVTSKFSKVSTYGNIRQGDTYLPNFTYHRSHREIYTAEAAAMINRERNQTSLTTQIGIRVYNNKIDTHLSIKLAVEAARKANKIHPGTVNSYVFYSESFLSSFKQANDTLETIVNFRNNSHLNGLKVGIRLRECSKYADALKDSKNNYITATMEAILRQVDFVVCVFRPFGNEHISKIGLKYIKPFLLNFRSNVQNINSNITVMGETYWVCKDPQRSANIDYIRTYWKIVDEFASEHNFIMWMYEAFDNPWRPSETAAHRGWWNLKRNSVEDLKYRLTEKMSGRCTPLNRNMTGVVFSPYVLHKKNKMTHSLKFYSMASIKTMLEVVSRKFSRISTTDWMSGDTDSHIYVRNSTYKTNREISITEAAALVNKERNQTVLTAYINIYIGSDEIKTHIAVQLAVEAILKANEMHKGTVTGVIFQGDQITSDEQKALQVSWHLMKFKNNPALEKVRVGFYISNCKDYKNAEVGLAHNKYRAMRMMILQSDFVVCSLPSSDHHKGPKVSFEAIKSDLLRFREIMRSVDTSIEVMGETFWPNFGPELEPWLSLDNMREYWIIVNEFASVSSFPMWLNEAFDTPWREGEYAHLGWWRLKSNSELNRKDGYTENYLAPGQSQLEITGMTLGNSTSPTEKSSATTVDTSTINFWIYVGSGTAVTISLLLAAALVIFFLKFNRNANVLTRQDVHEFLSGVSKSDLLCPKNGDENTLVESVIKLPYDKSYEIPKNALQIDQGVLLGAGHFGRVFKAKLNTKKGVVEIALKMAKPDCNRSALNGFLSEIKILMYLGQHDNIVSIHGAYTAELLNGVVYIATELCPLGSLLIYLRKSQFTLMREYENTKQSALYENDLITEPKSEVTIPEVSILHMVRWSYQIACGMEFLGRKSVVHADLALRNVLLTEDKTAKISDFGLSRRLYDYSNYIKEQHEPLPWRWMSIEALKQMTFSSKSDVWSYGVTLWEIFSKGNVPYPGFSLSPDFVDQLTKGMRMKSPMHASVEIYNIMTTCWNEEANERPSFADLKISIASVLNTLDDTYDELFE